MAFFGVTVETIKEVLPHPNADRLEIVTFKDIAFQSVVPKGIYAQGEHVLYFPEDATIPDVHLETMGLLGKLSKSKKNVVKTVKLRGVISQGVVAKFMDFFGDNSAAQICYIDPITKTREEIGEAIAEDLGVIKYEAPEVVQKNCTLRALPSSLSKYDIEGIERYADIAEMLVDVPCMITEKLEGSNFSVTCDANGEVFVNQRSFTIVADDPDGHTWWKVALRDGWVDFVKKMQSDHYKAGVTAYGEILGTGIQGNIYNLQKHEARMFDLRCHQKGWVNVEEMMFMLGSHPATVNTANLHVPILGYNVTLGNWLIDQFDGDITKCTDIVGQIKVASDGSTRFGNNPGILREGIVIRPMIEMTDEKLGRVILKQRSPEYLAS